MTIERKLLITSIMAGAFAVLAIGSGSWILFTSLKVAPLGGGQTHIDSPISASGGSMTFRAPLAQQGWKCASLGTGMPGLNDDCVAAANVSYIHSEGVEDKDSNEAGGQSLPATVTFYLRDSGGTASQNGGRVTLCTSNSPYPDGTCNGSGYVQIQVFYKYSGLIYGNAIDKTYANQAIQYFDSTCLVHRPLSPPPAGATDPPPSAILACEHPGYVVWPNTQTPYVCRHGACLVYLDLIAPPK